MISSLLLKPAGADCNMACRYCFYRPKAALYPDTPHPRMSPDVLREVVGQYMELCRVGPDVPDGQRVGDRPAHAGAAAFCWQGGEPTLMGLDFYRHVVALQQKHGHPGQVVGNSLQTNGLLLTDEWARFLARYRFLIGLSLDGPPEVHDHYRLNLGGAATQRQVLRAWRILQNHRVETNVLCMVTSHSAAKARLVFEYLRGLGVSFMQFIPCLEQHPRTGRPLPYTVSPEQYGEFLCELFDLWLPMRHEVSVRLFDDVLLRLTGHEQLVSCEFRPRCGDYLVVEHNGDLYACDFFVDRGHYLGNIATESLQQVAQGHAFATFGEQKGDYAELCLECEWLTFCQGGCPKHRLFAQRVGPDVPDGPEARAVRDVRPHATVLCESYRRFFAHALPALREIAQECQTDLQGTGPAV